MRTSDVVVQQRLNSSGVVVVLALVLALFVIVGVFIAGALTGPVPEVYLDLAYVVVLLFAALMVLASRIVVRVVSTNEGRALEVAYGPRGYFRQVFGARQVVAATSRALSDAQMIAGGYRGSLRLFRKASLITRRGEALDVQLSRGRSFLVTVDHPGDFVAALLASSTSP